jgi:hypothetical protein
VATATALRGVGRRWHSYVVAVVGRQWSGAGFALLSEGPVVDGTATS